jgi:hypothetical protein
MGWMRGSLMNTPETRCYEKQVCKNRFYKTSTSKVLKSARIWQPEIKSADSVLWNRVLKAGKLAITISYQNQNLNEFPAREGHEEEICLDRFAGTGLWKQESWQQQSAVKTRINMKFPQGSDMKTKSLRAGQGEEVDDKVSNNLSAQHSGLKVKICASMLNFQSS